MSKGFGVREHAAVLTRLAFPITPHSVKLWRAFLFKSTVLQWGG